MNLYYDTPFGKQQDEEEGPVPDVLRWTIAPRQEGPVPDVLRWTTAPLRFSQEHEGKRAISNSRAEISHSPKNRPSSTLPRSPNTPNQQHERTRGGCERAAERRRRTMNGRRDSSATVDNRRRHSSGRSENRSHDGASWRQRRQREYQQPGDRRKASIRIQTMVRRFLARARFEKLSQKKEDDKYDAYNNDRKYVQEILAGLMQERIQEKQRETEAEIKAMRESFESEKRAYGEQMRRKIEATMREQRDVKHEFEVQKEFYNQESISELEEEQKLLEATKNGLRDMNEEMREENKKLEQTNDEVSKMFSSLNDFARKKAEEKMKLAPVRQKLVKEQLPKARREHAQGVLECNIETTQKEIYRRHMYKTLNAVETTFLYDHELYEEVMDTVRSCETELGIETLDFNESFALTDGEAGDMGASFLLMSSSCESFGLSTTDFETS